VKTVSKLIIPAQEKLVEDDMTMQRLARSAQGGYGAPLPTYDAPLPAYDEPASPPPPAPLMPYRYGYAVQDTDCNDFNQQEQSDGNQVRTKVSVNISDHFESFADHWAVFSTTSRWQSSDCYIQC
jgi:hypothetical protein